MRANIHVRMPPACYADFSSWNLLRNTRQNGALSQSNKLYLLGLVFLQTDFNLEFTHLAWNFCCVAFVPASIHIKETYHWLIIMVFILKDWLNLVALLFQEGHSVFFLIFYSFRVYFLSSHLNLFNIPEELFLVF